MKSRHTVPGGQIQQRSAHGGVTMVMAAALFLMLPLASAGAVTVPLAISTLGTGSGKVTAGGGISCPGACAANYAPGTVVTLTAEANSGSGFVQWTGACSGTSRTCQVTMDAPKSVGATFNVPTTIPSGSVSGPVTWPLANSPYYVSGAVTVNPGATLSLDPGVIVKFAPMAGIAVNGALLAPGSADRPIQFTDYRDDSVGGDTNGDGTATTPSASWAGIYGNSGSALTFDHCTFAYGGFGWGYGANAYGEIYKNGGGPLSVTNSTFTTTNYWSSGAIYLDSAVGTVTITGNTLTGSPTAGYDGIYVINSGNNIAISGNTIQGFRNHGIELKSSSPAVGSNTFTANSYYGIYTTGATSLPAISAGNSYGGNGSGPLAWDVPAAANAHLYDAALPNLPTIVDSYGSAVNSTVAVDTTWKSERPYWFKNSPYVMPGVTLTIQSVTNKDVVTKWQGGTLVVDGNLQIVGTAAHKVYLTDYRDDTIGGDTNGNGASTVPAGSGWGGIAVNIGGTAAIDYADIRYGGSSNASLYKAGAGAVSLTNSSISYSTYWNEGISLNGTTGPVTISNNTITGGGTNNAYDGISLLNAGTNVIISGNTIQTNRWFGIVMKNSSPTITGNTIAGNLYYGFYVAGTSSPTITADNVLSSNTLGPMAYDVPALATAHLNDAALANIPIIVDTLGGNGSFEQKGDATWQSGRTYWFKSGPYIYPGVTLTLQAATNRDIVTKWAAGAQLAVAGNLVAHGGGVNKVYFTDQRDDTIGGDTNGAAGGTTPVPGWWDGINITANGTASLDACEIRYAGWNGRGIYKTGAGGIAVTNSVLDRISGAGIYLDATSAAHTISGTTIRNGTSNGIYFNNGGNGTVITGNSIYANSGSGISLTGAAATPTIVKNSIYGNNVGVYATNSANPLVGGSAGNGNVFLSNTVYSVQNTTAAILLDARYNDWGSVNGPYHAVTNPTGNLQSRVSDYVDYGSFALPQLFVSIIGLGTVEGTSTKLQNFTCTTSACSAPFANGDQISLAATPNAGFSLAGWSGNCNAASGPCNLTMDGDKSVTATFTTALPVLLVSSAPATVYGSFGAAYGAIGADSSVTIQAQATTISGGFILDRNVAVTLEGGYDSSFNNRPGLSVLQGGLSILKGALVVDRLAIE